MAQDDTEADDEALPVVQDADMEKRVQQFRDVRDAIKRIEKKHTEELKPYLNAKEILSGRIGKFMETHKLENLRTKNGTATLGTKYTATVADGALFMDFVKQDHWDMIERRANATVVRAWVKENKSLPPGVSLSGVQTVGVQRPTAKKK